MRFISLLLVVLYPVLSFGKLPSDEPEFVIVTTSYNNGSSNNNLCLKNLASIASQTYPKFSVIYVDDVSSDDTASLVDNFVSQNHLENKIKVIHNTERKGAMRNIYETIHTIEPDKIVVMVDGDDMLAHKKVLEYLASVYKDKKVWITYGSLITFTQGRFKHHPDHSPEVVFRAMPPSPRAIATGDFSGFAALWYHPKTFYAKLFQLIKKEDLFYEGDFYPASSDLAFMRRMLEMASRNHFKPIGEILYHYYISPISECEVRRDLQIKVEKDVWSKPPYKPLETLF